MVSSSVAATVDNNLAFLILNPPVGTSRRA
jgi:hypothetical protein